MKYIIINKDVAEDIGIHSAHYQLGKDKCSIVINENDLMRSYAPGQTLAEKAEILGVEILSLSDFNYKKQNGGF